MIISRERRILFIHVPRTGGASITNLLLERVGDAAFFLEQHSSAREAKEELGDDFEDYHRFAFVRNPWERLVSWYCLLEKGRRMGEADDGGGPDRSFGNFLKQCAEEEGEANPGVCEQADLLCDESGATMVNEVGRFENFEGELRRILEGCGVAADGIPRVNTTEHGHYRSYYSEEDRERARGLFSRDVECFGYEFEDGD